MTVKIIQGDALEVLRTLPDESVHCCVTSPPYWGLRDYGTAKWEGGDADCDHKETRGGIGASSSKQVTSAGASTTYQYRDICAKCGARRIDSQLGLEKTPDEYVAKMVEVFREVRRVLRSDGTLWLNLGDSYNANQGKGFDTNQDGGERKKIAASPKLPRPQGLKPKDLCGIPWRVAFALQADGWYLRQDIIWSKPNPMPESVTDRCTKSHEYIFLLSKSQRYYYDAEAIKEPLECKPHAPGNTKLDSSRNDHDQMEKIWGKNGNRNKRSVWVCPTAPFPGAHFATFPPRLIEPCILAGCPETICAKCGSPHKRLTETKYKHHEKWFGDKQGARHSRGTAANGYDEPIETITVGFKPTCNCDAGTQSGTVLDPFGGSGTVGMVAEQNGCNSILIELNPKYVDMAKRRTAQQGLFAEAAN